MFGVGVLGVGEGWVPAMWGSAAAAPLRPGHPPAFSLRSSASPLRWSEGGLGWSALVGCCLGGNDGAGWWFGGFSDSGGNYY